MANDPISNLPLKLTYPMAPSAEKRAIAKVIREHNAGPTRALEMRSENVDALLVLLSHEI
jgi:hypothetical protein